MWLSDRLQTIKLSPPSFPLLLYYRRLLITTIQQFCFSKIRPSGNCYVDISTI